MKKAGLQTDDLVLFFKFIILRVLEYASAVWHSSLTQDQSSLLEAVQNRVMRIIYGVMSYTDACYFAKPMPLEERRRQTAKFSFIKMQDSKNILHHLLPPLQRTSIRNTNPRQPIRTDTDRFKNSFIPYSLNNFQ